MITAHRSNSKRPASYENLEEHRGWDGKNKGKLKQDEEVRQTIQTRALVPDSSFYT